MWDGNGLRDRVYDGQRYETYKLALLILVARTLNEIPPMGASERLWSLQSESGGIHTHYEAEGEPRGFTNTETTSLAILASTASG